MKRAFSLLELLIVIAIIAILAALIVPASTHSMAAARKASCLNHLHQIDLATIMYVDDHSDAIRALTNKEPVYFTYKTSILPYLVRNGSETNDAVFTCPSDDFNCSMQAVQDFFLFDNVSGIGFHHLNETLHSSYFFDGEADDVPRLNGKPFSTVREPSRQVLIGELSAAIGLSAHERKQPAQFNNAKNVLGFVDGHVSFVPIYWDGTNGIDGMPVFYDPPPGYDYTWFGTQ